MQPRFVQSCATKVQPLEEPLYMQNGGAQLIPEEEASLTHIGVLFSSHIGDCIVVKHVGMKLSLEHIVLPLEQITFGGSPEELEEIQEAASHPSA